MDRELASDSIAGFVRAHLDRAALTSTEPLVRSVDILSRHWDAWLTAGGHPGSASYVGPLEPPRVAAAADARKGLTPRDPLRRGADLETDRAHLLALSARAANSNERRCVALWVATMMWGSGTLNGRGPWRTAQGLAFDGLGALLTQSHRRLRANDVAEAYRIAATIPGSAESSFTKWLWAASLGLDDPAPQPLVLDGRVRATLASIGVRPSHNATGYVDYVETMALAAAELRSADRLRGATPEKLEWLLSVRAP